MATLLLLDTSVYIHGRDFIEVAWNEAVNRDAVEIVAPLTLVRELDRIKDHNPQRRIRERARHVLQLMESRDAPDGVEIRPGVRFRMLPFPPGDAFLASKTLDPSVADDQILGAAMKAVVNEPEGTTLVVLSRDTSQRIVARRVGLEVFALPETLSLKEADDPLEKENLDLRRQLAVATDKRVSLTFLFADGANFAKLAPFPLNRAQRPSLAALHEKANSDAPAFTSMGLPTASSARRGFRIGGPVEYSQQAVDCYESERRQHLQDLATYHAKWDEWEALLARTFELKFHLANCGTIPAEDASAVLWISDAESVFDADKFPMLPTAPVSPSLHQWVVRRDPTPYNPRLRTYEETRRNPLIPSLSQLYPNEAHPRISSRARPGEFAVSWSTKKLQQGDHLACDPVYVTLRENKSLIIEATVSADAFGPIASKLTLIPTEEE